MNWNNITLHQFQQIDIVNHNNEVSDIDKVLLSTCIAYGIDPIAFDNMGDTKRTTIKAVKMTQKVSKLFESKIDPKPFNKIGKYFIDYEVSKFTFGQYVELCYFLQKPLEMAHYSIASVSHLPLLKVKAKSHRRRSEYFLQKPISKIIGCVNKIIEEVKKFNKDYAVLFGLDKEVTGDVQSDKFNQRYGWIYSATQIAEHERITLDEVFNLPVRQALNDLAFLKAKSKYEYEQSKMNK